MLRPLRTRVVLVGVGVFEPPLDHHVLLFLAEEVASRDIVSRVVDAIRPQLGVVLDYGLLVRSPVRGCVVFKSQLAPIAC